VGIYVKNTDMTTQSKTMQALARVAQGEKVATVAKDLGISQAAIYAAMKRRTGKEVCPCCGQVVREGFAVKT
jgi:DNA-binding phage protein